MRLEIIPKRRRAERPVALADEELRGVPAIVAAYVHTNELREGFCVLIDPPEILVLGFAHRVTEARSDRVDEN